ncbi:MAG: Lrp/AsnC family transcriptional regulator [Ktedonobacterales bacterium]|nr:Lrp/AsnC family transcriptional regulator [Ktedonobacterales bacterium]
MDEVDWRILEELQEHARRPLAEVGRRVGLTAPAVAERVRRLELAGVITGYHAAIDTDRLGLSLAAFVRFSVTTGTYPQLDQLLRHYPEILECHRVTGSDCYIMCVAVASIRHLEDLINRLTPYGTLTTSIVLSSPITRRTLTPANLAWEADERA